MIIFYLLESFVSLFRKDSNMITILNAPSIVLRSGKTLRGEAPKVLRSGKILIDHFIYEKKRRRRVTPPSSSFQIQSILGRMNSNQNKVHWNMSLSVIELDNNKYFSPIRKREVRIRNRTGKRYD